MMTIQRALCGLAMLMVLGSCARFGNDHENGDGGPGGAADSCTTSGGTISTSNCCISAADFPNTCAIGACGCAPANSHEVKTCECPADKCFDGSRCVGR